MTPNGSLAEISGAIMMVAVIGWTTSASNGTPISAKPPPNAPFPNEIRKMVESPTT